MRVSAWLAVPGGALTTAGTALAASIPLPRAAPRPRAGGGGWVEGLGHAAGRFLLQEPGALWYLLAVGVVAGLGYLGWTLGGGGARGRDPCGGGWDVSRPPAAGGPAEPAGVATDTSDRDPVRCPNCFSRYQYDGRACDNCGHRSGPPDPAAPAEPATGPGPEGLVGSGRRRTAARKFDR